MSLELRLKNCKFTVFTLKERQADEFHGHEDVYQISIPLRGKSIMQHEQTRRQWILQIVECFCLPASGTGTRQLMAMRGFY